MYHRLWHVLSAALLLTAIAACAAPPAASPTALATRRMAASPTLPISASPRTPATDTPQLDRSPIATTSAAPLSPNPQAATPNPTPRASPTPTPPLGQALPAFWRSAPQNALLYNAAENVLILTDPDGRQPLVLSEEICPRARTYAIYARWSANGQYIAIRCAMQGGSVTAFVLDVQSGQTQQITTSEVVDLLWSPVGSRLLVTEEGPYGARTSIVEAATGARADLPVVAYWWCHGVPWCPDSLWHNLGGGQGMYDQPDADWSPDGAQLAIIGTSAGVEGLYIVDATSLDARPILKLVEPDPHAGDLLRRRSLIQAPRWSPDGQSLIIHENVSRNGVDASFSPSSSYDRIALQIDLASRQEQIIGGMLYQEPGWSPDGQYYFQWVIEGDGSMVNSRLYQASGEPFDRQPNQFPGQPIWMPDSRHFLTQAYQAEQQAVQTVLHSLDGDQRLLFSSSLGNTFPQIRPVSPLAPDGTLLAVPDAFFQVSIYDLQGQVRTTFPALTLAGWRPLSGGSPGAAQKQSAAHPGGTGWAANNG